MKQKNYKSGFQLLIFVLSVLNSGMMAQASWNCGAREQAYTNAQALVSQPSDCIKLLNDFAPAATDSVIEIKVRFTVFTPAAGPGTWGNSATTARAKNALRIVDSLYSHIAVNTYSIGSPVAHIPDTRIRFVMDGNLNLVSNQTAYDMIANMIGSVYSSDNAINVFYGREWYNGMICDTVTHICDSSFFSAPDVPDYFPNTHVLFPMGRPAWPRVIDLGNDTMATVLAHELGHILGLPENIFWNDTAVTCFGAAYIKPTFGCCKLICANDYVIEPWKAPWGTCDHPGISNNMMSYNIGCHQYFSPQQMAVMHYNLRTFHKHRLTTRGFNAATIRNPSSDYTLSTNEVWTSDRYFKGHVIVPAGKTLLIKCAVAMTNGAKILVKKGGSVLIDGGKVTNISGRLWDGIEVEGDPALGQTSGAPSWTNHGLLEIRNGSTIENSVNAIRNYGYDAGGNPWLSGGIIRCSDTKFLNNVRDVEFRAYPIILGSSSRFDRCEFKTTGAINSGALPYVHVSLWGIKDVQFNACQFENAAQSLYPHTGQGIHSIDAVYHVTQACSFKGFKEAISVNNSNPLRTVNVSASEFENNLTGLEFSTVRSAMVSRNSFTLTQANSKGIAFNYCDLYSISNNSFKGPGGGTNGSVGIYASMSFAGTHRIYRNDFSSLNIGISPQFDNSGLFNQGDGLFMNCNTFTSSPNFRDIVMQGDASSNITIPTVARDQGVLTDVLFPANTNPRRLVRNLYGAACITNGQKKWYVHHSSSKIISHVNNSDAVTTLTPQPDCSKPVIQAISAPVLFSYATDCPATANRPADPGCPCPDCCLYAEISQGLSQALAATHTLSTQYNNLLDGGHPQGLLDSLSNFGFSGAVLKDILLRHSPYLSDTVLISFFENPGVSPDQAERIHRANAPVRPAVWNLMATKGFTSAAVKARQDSFPISARESLEGQLRLAKADLQAMYSEKLNYFLRDTLAGAQDTVIRLLAENLGGIPNTVPLLVNAYANAGYYSRAFAYADSLSADPRYTELMSLQTAFLKLDTARNKISTLQNDLLLSSLLAAYADDSTKAGSMAARAVLHEMGSRNMNFVYLLPEEEGGEERRAATASSSLPAADQSSLLQVYPNPAAQGFTLLYSGPAATGLRYTLRDVLGKESRTGTLQAQVPQEISTERLANGIYFLTLIQEHRVLESRKLVILK